MPVLPTHDQYWQATLQWQPDAAQQALFQRLFEGILAGNQQMNLTRITTPDEFWEKHLWDALSGLEPWLVSDLPAWCSTPALPKTIDIGTGAGIPGLPAAIALPNWQINLLDSTQKKVRFLQALSTSLSLDQVTAIADRAEFLAHQPSHRELYDIAMLRAVGPAATCVEYALPLLKVGGVAVLYRGQWTESESLELDAIADQLGGHLVDVKAWQTPLTQGVRHCLYVQKRAVTTDEFPRAVGIPAKFPLAP
ncbi:MAG: 16S rRNA (guanine(527)-N(7))-methyltransferase RsmG [Leptolyngbyaceae cyanobacterium]